MDTALPSISPTELRPLLGRADAPLLLDVLLAALPLHDAVYAWCRDGRDESHDWQGQPAPRAAA